MTAADQPAEFTVYAHGLVYASVCTSLPDDEAADRLALHAPTPTTWTVADEPFATGEPNGRPCDQHPDTHRHLLFVC